MLSADVVRLRAGDRVPAVAVRSLRGEPITLPASDGDSRLIHLQFRRFAGCPICNRHVRSVAARIDELRAANLREIALFHSTASTMWPFQGDLPFEIVADPDKLLYRAFGVEASLRSLVDPRAWGGFLRGIVAQHPSSSTTGEGGAPRPARRLPGGQIRDRARSEVRRPC